MITAALSSLATQNTIPSQAARSKASVKSGSFNEMLVREENKIDNSKEISKVKLRSEMHNIRKVNPTLRESYDKAMQSARAKEVDIDGIKIALKELAKQFENQFTSILWHKMLKKDTGTLAERLWSSERTQAFVESDEELGEIGEHIYNELLEEIKIEE